MKQYRPAFYASVCALAFLVLGKHMTAPFLIGMAVVWSCISAYELAKIWLGDRAEAEPKVLCNIPTSHLPLIHLERAAILFAETGQARMRGFTLALLQKARRESGLAPLTRPFPGGMAALIQFGTRSPWDSQEIKDACKLVPRGCHSDIQVDETGSYPTAPPSVIPLKPSRMRELIAEGKANASATERG